MVGEKKKDADPFPGIPLGGALEVVEGVGGLLAKYLAQRYEVEKRVEELKVETAETVDEIREEAVRTGYAVKKAFLRSVVETILLTTGLLSLIAGLILVVRDVIPLRYVLLGYGILITAFIAFQVKTAPEA